MLRGLIELGRTLLLIIYTFLGSDLTGRGEEFLRKCKKQIQDAITKKFKDAGVDKVEFREGSSLTKTQIEEIKNNYYYSAGVALLEFDNLRQGSKTFGSNILGGHDPQMPTSAVFLGNINRGNDAFDATTAFRLGEVASHELGHSVGK